MNDSSIINDEIMKRKPPMTWNTVIGLYSKWRSQHIKGSVISVIRISDAKTREAFNADTFF